MAGFGSTGTGRGSKSSGLDVEHTLLVAIRRLLGCSGQAPMAEQQLNGPDIGAGLEQMDGECVPQGIIAMLMNFTQRRSAIVITLSTA